MPSMTTLPNPSKNFKGRHLNQEIILLCVRWYVTYKLSYRGLVEMMEERGRMVALLHNWPVRLGAVTMAHDKRCLYLPIPCS